MNDLETLILFGAESSICADVLETMHRASIKAAASILTGPAEWDMDGIGPVVQAEKIPARLRETPFVVPWMAPGWRKERNEAALRLGLKPIDLLVDPTAVLPRAITIGPGCYINAGVVIGAQAELDASVFINRNASLGHHTRAEDYVSIGPGATVAARVRLGKGCFIGAGATIASGVSIGANSVVGSGASVYRDLPDNALAVGNPFRIAKTGIAGYQGVGV